MRRFVLALVVALASLTTSFVAVEARGGARDYIVRYTDAAVVGARTNLRVASDGARFQVRQMDQAKVQRRVQHARSWGIKPTHVFRHAIGGFSAHLTPAQVQRLRDDPTVASVEIDAPVSVADGRVEGGVVSRGEFGSQQVPSGIKRIYADRQPLAHIGARTDIDVDIAIIDTGIADHPDLRIAGGVNCSDSAGGYTDRYGHGTHVAGIVGARDNDRGVVGVVPGARLWAIKVLGDDGTGRTSEIVCGLDWMIGKQTAAGGPRFIAANMSIAGPQAFPNTPCGVGTNDVYHIELCRAMDAGIVFAVAAANDHRVVNQRPAVYDEPITVAALADYDGKPGGHGRQKDVCPWYSSDSDDSWADFSDWGKAVDIVAPGKCILSTFKNGRYAWMSGTSMATPHVTGAIALYRMRYPDALPQQVKQALVTAGSLNWKTSTAPDGRSYRLLQVRYFTQPPTFSIASVTSPSVPLGGEGTERAVKVRIRRIDGHYRPIRVSVSAPDAVSSQTLRIGDNGKAGTLVLQGTGALRTGTVTVTVRATDGELGATRTVAVPVDADPPVVSIQAPSGGSTIIQSSSSRTIRATSSDTYTGVVRRTLQRRRALQTAPMSCDGATWSDDGAPRTISTGGSGPWTSEGLRSGYCYRWYVTAFDRAGNATVGRSAIVWTDVSAPEVPVLQAIGDAAARGTTVWFRAGTSGGFTLEATARDPHSTIRAVSVGAASGSGWDTTSSSSRTLSGVTGTATRRYTFGAGAGSASVAVSATDGVGKVRHTVVAFRADAAAPTLTVRSPATFTWLGSPSTTVRYAASDHGSGLSTVVARRERTTLRSRSEGCDTSWVADGGPVTVSGGAFTVTGLERGACYRWVITANDGVGHHRTVATDAVAIDPTRPVVDRVGVNIARGTVGTGGSIPVNVSWRLRTKPVGSTSFELQRTVDGGTTWAAVEHPQETSRSQPAILSNGRPTTVAVRARSSTGVSSSWAVSRRVTARLVQENGAGVSTSSHWSRVAWESASGGYRLASSHRGAKVTFRFTGDSVAIVAGREPGLGTAIVRVDGKRVATVALRAHDTRVRQVVWVGRVSPGRHAVTVTVSSGRVLVDGFIVTTRTSGDAR